MSPTWATFLFEAANFLVLAGVLGWLFFKPVRQALADQRAKFEADAVLAAEKLATAEQAQQEIEATRTNLQSELTALRTRELEAARRQAEQILAEARAAAEREREISHRQAARMADRLRDRLAEVSAIAAAETVGCLLKQIGGSGSNLHSALIESACQQLGSLPPNALLPVTVESAEPLSPEHLAALHSALGPAADAADFRTVDGLGAGVRISTGKGLIDASVSGLTQFARQALVKAMNHRENNRNPLQSTNDA
ncbi:MAG: hypothetical protein R3F37_11940 [Candidatus Competibacteraceae bacterium]